MVCLGYDKDDWVWVVDCVGSLGILFWGGYEYTRFGLVWVVFWLGEGKRMPYLGCVQSGGFTDDGVERSWIFCLFKFW